MQEAETSPKAAYHNLSIVYDPEQKEFIHVDDTFPGLNQKAYKEITPELLLGTVHPEDRNYVREKFEDFLNGTLKGSIEFRAKIEEEIFWIRLTPFSISIDSRSLYAAIAVDITSEWNNGESIRRYANKKNSILNMLAHDLRGPLDIAHTLTKSITKKTADPGVINMCNSIEGILKQSVDMISNLIDRELLETVEVELVMKRIDIVKKVTEYVDECKMSQPALGRTFKLTSSHDSIYLDLDEAKFMQVMNNLMSNALKFTHPGGQISIDIAGRNGSVLFTFSDNGIGIPEDHHDTIFDKFTGARRKGLNGEPTVGLGLSIVKMIIEWHKGKIWFESKEDAGTTFHFEIPKINDK